LFQRELFLTAISPPWLEDEPKREAFPLKPLNNLLRAIGGAAIYQNDL
jgi:hypothetical protein